MERLFPPETHKCVICKRVIGYNVRNNKPIKSNSIAYVRIKPQTDKIQSSKLQFQID